MSLNVFVINFCSESASGIKTCIHYLLTVQLCTNKLTCLNLSFLIYKVVMILLPNS